MQSFLQVFLSMIKVISLPEPMADSPSPYYTWLLVITDPIMSSILHYVLYTGDLPHNKNIVKPLIILYHKC
jgi:hypothetical protein